MKKKIHPKYQEILFIDSSTNFKFICGSTLQTKETDVYEGKEYPACKISVSSSSHPFFTGSNQFIDTEGRVGRFTKKYAKKKEELQQKQEQEKQKKEEQGKKKKKIIKKKTK